MARLLLGVSGSIAAYKAVETARLAIRAGHAVRVIQTPVSRRFVGAATFAAITGAPVLTSEFEPDPARGAYPGEPLPAHAPISHLALVERADAYLIAPASANTLADLAAGRADTLVSTAALAAACPVLVAPAMNARMYLHAATAANLATLARRGVTVIPPDEGALASHGEQGIGRLPEPSELLARVEQALAPSPPLVWSGVRVLVTAGGTREPIDSVRYIGNRSSGRMGLALAAQAAARGAQVTAIAANVALDAAPGVELVRVETAAELAAACRRAFEDCDILLMAAAVADFRPASPAARKLKKTDPEAPQLLELEATEDVLSSLAEHRRPDQLLVGFAAEHGDGAVAYGRDKLERKGLDAIVVNDISRAGIGFDAADNEVVIVARDGSERTVPRASKESVAAAILDEVTRLREQRHGRERDGAGEPASVGGARG
jgi:phosphopantothenoylcysteine decarboxylase/phosphopantothenate--cysteine ligase